MLAVLQAADTYAFGRLMLDVVHAHAGAANGPANGSDYDAGRVEYDVASALIIYEEYHPFGTSAYRAVDSTIEVSAKRYRYAAAERDEETGLDHMGLRYYAPWLGRWTSADPIGLGDGVNRYAYVHGNPIKLSDPSGMAPPQTPDPKPGFEHLGMLVTTGRGSGGKGPTVLYSEGDDPGPLHPEAAKKQAQRREDAVARRAEAGVKRDYEKTQNLASPDALFEDYPAHLEPYLRDQSAGTQDDFLKFNAQAQQRMSRALGRVTGGGRYATNITMGVMGMTGEASVLAQPAVRGGFEAARGVARTAAALERTAAAEARGAANLQAAGEIAGPGLAPDIALGRQSAGLKSFAEAQGAVEMSEWAELGLYDAASVRGWGEAFTQAANRTVAGGRRIHFDLTDLDVPRALAGDPSEFVGRYTAWELQQVVRNPAWFKATTFYEGGAELTASQVAERGIQLLKVHAR